MWDVSAVLGLAGKRGLLLNPAESSRREVTFQVQLAARAIPSSAGLQWKLLSIGGEAIVTLKDRAGRISHGMLIQVRLEDSFSLH